MSTLSARAGQALRWGTLTLLARMGLQLVAQVLLARLLGPGAYGVYALGLALLTFTGFLAGNGFAYGLVLRPHIGEADIRLAFTWQVLAGLAGAALLAASAPALAGFFHAPALAPTLRWMALACAFNAGAGTALALMQRALDQRRQGLLQLSAYALGYLGAGLPLALAGFGAEALAAACAVQAAATLALALWLQPHPLRPLWRGPARAATLGTGGRVFLTNMVNWLSANLDRLVIGRCLPAPAVGVFALAWNLSQVPVALLVGATQPALVAAGTHLRAGGRREARRANEGPMQAQAATGEEGHITPDTSAPDTSTRDLRRLAGAWEMANAGAASLLPTAALCGALLAPDLIALLYGPAWQASGPLLALMLLCLPAWTAWALATPVLWHTGRPQQEATLQLPLLLLALPLWAWAALDVPGTALADAEAHTGRLLAVAGVTALLLHARAWLTVRAALKRLGRSPARLASPTWRGLALAACCALALLAGQEAASWIAAQVSPGFALEETGVATAGLRLATGGVSALGCAWGLLAVRPSLIGPQALALLRRAGVAGARP